MHWWIQRALQHYPAHRPALETCSAPFQALFDRTLHLEEAAAAIASSFSGVQHVTGSTVVATRPSLPSLPPELPSLPPLQTPLRPPLGMPPVATDFLVAPGSLDAEDEGAAAEGGSKKNINIFA